jgi:hypothetical protein
MVMVAFGLTEVVITNAVDEDHQHRPCHEEQDRSRERIDQHADLQPGLTCRQPVDRRLKWMFAKMFHVECAPKTIIAPNHERKAALTATVWLRALLLFVNNTIKKMPALGWQGN